MTDINIIRDWMNRYNFFTCEPTRELAASATTAEEFYDGLNIVNHFFTGIANNHPEQALSLIMGCIEQVLPAPKDEVLSEARAVAIDPNADIGALKENARVLTVTQRTRKVPFELRGYYNLIYQLLCWRLGRMTKMISAVIASKIIDVRRKNFGDNNAQQTVLSEMKKRLPFEEWIKGIQEELTATPYR